MNTARYDVYKSKTAWTYLVDHEAKRVVGCFYGAAAEATARQRCADLNAAEETWDVVPAALGVTHRPAVACTAI